MADLTDTLAPWLDAGLLALGAVLVSLAAHWLAFAALERLTRGTATKLDNALVRYGRRPSRLVIALFALILVLPAIELSDETRTFMSRGLSMLLTGAIGWLAFRLTRSIDDVVAARYDLSAADNLRAREVYTRVRVLRRVLAALILAITASIILMSIPSIRQIGVTLFASAGIAGLIAGFAARPVLSNLLAGIQLAITQPIRIDDVVIVEGEWGWIEEIRMTFVVVRVWDQRRLVVPLSYFIETPFENWTRKSADILGTVYLYADYSLPVAPVREKLHEILQASELWDGKAWSLQVTGTSERAMELRALMGARNSGDAWTLRCQVREELIGFLQREYPEALPRLRLETGEEGPGRGPATAAADQPTAPPL